MSNGFNFWQIPSKGGTLMVGVATGVLVAHFKVDEVVEDVGMLIDMASRVIAWIV